jgi:hypothetical protein
MNNSRDLTPADRAVYHLAERGGLDAAHAALYRRQLSNLARHGLVTRMPDGAYLVVPSRTHMPSEPPPAPSEPPMATLVVRVPQAWLDELDAHGPTRSEALRAVLGPAVKSLAGKSGQRKAG